MQKCYPYSLWCLKTKAILLRHNSRHMRFILLQLKLDGENEIMIYRWPSYVHLTSGIVSRGAWKTHATVMCSRNPMLKFTCVNLDDLATLLSGCPLSAFLLSFHREVDKEPTKLLGSQPSPHRPCGKLPSETSTSILRLSCVFFLRKCSLCAVRYLQSTCFRDQ
jgi:hypothetical protein